MYQIRERKDALAYLERCCESAQNGGEPSVDTETGDLGVLTRYSRAWWIARPPIECLAANCNCFVAGFERHRGAATPVSWRRRLMVEMFEQI